MGTYREHDPLVELLLREHGRVLECVLHYASGEAPARTLGEARSIVRALADVEANVLYGAFAKVTLRPETERLLGDCRDNRAQQLDVLDALAHKRMPRLRKLKAAELCDLLQQHAEQHVTLLIPVLRSQLPRVVYRSVFHAFLARYTEQLDQLVRTTRRAPAPAAVPPQ